MISVTFSVPSLVQRMNLLCGQGEPFLFVIDYKAQEGIVLKNSELEDNNIFCSINGVELNNSYLPAAQGVSELKLSPISFAEYKASFDKVQRELGYGNSYLLNLTFPTDLGRDIELQHIYAAANAPYKMLFDDDFVFYSPESFIKIRDNKIYSFPMKGTIDAAIEDTEAKLLGSYKERYKHNTIVYLIRNDLSMVSRGVQVDKFRYLEHIKTSNGEIYQTNSQISGNLEDGWKTKFGDILFSMLPAGSISGAPKRKTLEIIEDCESSRRVFYCGVMGWFDGVGVDSCVIIRYIEKGEDGSFYYRSGGGITLLSNAQEEYDELIKKVYVPTI